MSHAPDRISGPSPRHFFGLLPPLTLVVFGQALVSCGTSASTDATASPATASDTAAQATETVPSTSVDSPGACEGTSTTSDPAGTGGTPAQLMPMTGGNAGLGGVRGLGGSSGRGGSGAEPVTETDGGAGATLVGGGPSAQAGSSNGGASIGSGGTTDTGGEAGTGGAIDSGGSGGAVDVIADALYASPDGTAGAMGTIDDPLTLSEALARADAGVTIYARGGTYALGTTLRLDGDGSEGAPIQLLAYPLDAERPRLDFSAMAESSDNRGLELSGSFWHVYGLDVFGAGDNCMFVGGSNNTVEFSTFSECADTGLQLGNGAADNLVLNCDSFFNADSSLENADGFAAKLDVGTGNRFVGCRAWNNLDDGWDGYLRPADNVTTVHDNCWAIDNGKLKDGTVGAGDGNGFKTGGSDGKDLSHNAVYTRCIAAGNVNDGFDHNSNRGNVTILNSAAHDNGSNINFGTSNIAASLEIKNTVSVGELGDLEATRTDLANNSWQDDLSASESDFVSLDMAQLKGPRKSDGSLPDIDYLVLTPDSPLRNAGVDIGLPFSGSAPDIGPFESDE